MKIWNGDIMIKGSIDPSRACRSISDSITPQSLGLWT